MGVFLGGSPGEAPFKEPSRKSSSCMRKSCETRTPPLNETPSAPIGSTTSRLRSEPPPLWRSKPNLQSN